MSKAAVLERLEREIELELEVSKGAVLERELELEVSKGAVLVERELELEVSKLAAWRWENELEDCNCV